MTGHIIDGNAIGRQQILQMLRDVCAASTDLCDADVSSDAEWPKRAQAVVKNCMSLQRGLIRSHPRVADDLHLLASEIQIACAAQSDAAIFSSRIRRIRDAVRRIQQLPVEAESLRQLPPGAGKPV